MAYGRERKEFSVILRSGKEKQDTSGCANEREMRKGICHHIQKPCFWKDFLGNEYGFIFI